MQGAPNSLWLLEFSCSFERFDITWGKGDNFCVSEMYRYCIHILQTMCLWDKICYLTINNSSESAWSYFSLESIVFRPSCINIIPKKLSRIIWKTSWIWLIITIFNSQFSVDSAFRVHLSWLSLELILHSRRAARTSQSQPISSQIWRREELL